MDACKFCGSAEEKSSEINLGPILINQITKYKYLSELVELENKSHCYQQFNELLKRSKEPFPEQTSIVNNFMLILILLVGVMLFMGIVLYNRISNG